MRKLVVTENITVDGVIDSAKGWFVPSGKEEVDVSDIVEAIRQQREAADALLVGRVTFEELRGFWPAQTDDTTGISDYLNAVPKYVVSKTLDDPQWEHTTVLSGPVEELVAELKSQPGKDIVATGSMTLVRELVAKQLVDEYRLFVYPVVVGEGQRLFQDTRPGEAGAAGVDHVRVRRGAPALSAQLTDNRLRKRE